MAQLYTDVELAKRFGVAVSTVRRWRGDNTGPAHIIIGTGTVRYREEDVLAYENRAATGGEIPSRAKDAMESASGALLAVINWPINDAKRTTLFKIRENLQNLIDEGKTS